MKKILFALNDTTDNVIEESILNYYKEHYKEEFSYTKEYYIQGVYKCLKEVNYDILVLNQTLEAQPITIQTMDYLTDKFPNLRIVLAMENSDRETNLPNQLFSIGAYDCIYKDNLNIPTITKILHEKRTKKEAKDYYNFDLHTEDKVDIGISVTEINKDELQKIIEHFSDADADNIGEKFKEIDNGFNFQEMIYVLCMLDNSIIELLNNSNNKNYLKYKKELDNQLKKAIKEKEYIDREVIKEVIKTKEVEKIKIVKEKEYIDREVIREVYKTPGDYKKAVAIMGTDNSGKTTLVEDIGRILAQNKIKVAILDLTNNKDFFEKKIMYSDEDINEPLLDLKKGELKPLRIEKNLDLYTSVKNKEENIGIDMIHRIINILKREYDVVLVDSHINNELYNLVDKVYMTTTSDLTEIKYISEHLYEVGQKQSQGEGLNNLLLVAKLNFIFNKTIVSKETIPYDQLKECCCTLTDFKDPNNNISLLEYTDIKHHIVPFDMEVMKNSYREMIFNKKWGEEYIDALRLIATVIYPLDRVIEKKGLFKNIFNRRK